MSYKPNSSVYFARVLAWNGQDLGAIKVGLAIDPTKRVGSVCSQQPYECELITSVPGDIFVESFVHMWLRQLHIGGEYFKAIGETMRIVEHVQANGKLPFPISFTKDGMHGKNFDDIDVTAFLAARSMTVEDVEKLAGVGRGYYQRLAEKKVMNRRFLAALAVATIKRGEAICWPLDFIPQKPERVGRHLGAALKVAA